MAFTLSDNDFPALTSKIPSAYAEPYFAPVVEDNVDFYVEDNVDFYVDDDIEIVVDGYYEEIVKQDEANKKIDEEVKNIFEGHFGETIKQDEPYFVPISEEEFLRDKIAFQWAKANEFYHEFYFNHIEHLREWDDHSIARNLNFFNYSMFFNKVLGEEFNLINHLSMMMFPFVEV
jgi:hypothetical protein